MAPGLGRFLDALPIPVALVDRRGTITYANASAVERYGWRSATNVIGLSVAVLGEGLPERLAGGTWGGELPATSAAGTFQGLFLVSPYRDEEAGIDGSLVVCLDTSRRQEAERAAARLAVLQGITADLGAARDADAVATVICHGATAGLGAECGAFLRLHEAEERLDVVLARGFDPELAVDAAWTALRDRTLVRLAEPLPGHRCDVVVPVVHHDRPLGAIAFGFERHELDEDDERFLLAIAAQTAQALERVRLDDLERRARRRQEFLARATGLLAGTLDHEATALAVGRLTVQELADSFSVHLLDGEHLRTVTAVHRDPELEELLRDVVNGPAGDLLARLLDEVVRSGRSVFQPVVGDVSLGDDEAARQLAPFDIGSAIIVGLHAGGRPLGALTVTRRTDRPPFDEDAFVIVSELASRLAATVDSVVAHRARAEEARTLQASLLPPRLPEIAGVRLASRYEPVGDGSLVGGDFYDAFPMNDGRWGLVLGDVSGHGIPAAALTALVRYTVRAAGRIWQSPAEILRFTNAAILDHDIGERFCTLLLCVLRPGPDGVVATVAAAGHHLPLLVTAAGPAQPVGQTGTALGLVAHPDFDEVTVSLGVGDLLVLYTDGVVEARGEDGALVDETFLDSVVATHAGDGAEGLAAAIERAVLKVGGGRAFDDVAVLVAEATGERTEELVGDDDRAFDARFRVEVSSAPEARRAVGHWLERHGVRGPRIPDLLLALTELVTNAVHVARDAIEVRCWLTDDAVMIEVTDDGPGFDGAIPSDAREIDPMAARGRGLFLVAHLVDECTIVSGTSGTIVRCLVAR